MEKSIDGYFLYGIDDEMLMVVRGFDDELMLRIIDRLIKSRDREIKQLGMRLEEHFSERQDDGRYSVKVRSKDKKKGTGGINGND